MQQPSFYPHAPDSVQLVQTHISYVLLAGNEVFKVKKPVCFSFLDFSTLEKRRHFCDEEVRLNSRLAPGVYRGVRSVCREDGRYRLGDEGDPSAAEYVVHMRRLPEEQMLDRLLERQRVPPDLVDTLVSCLTDFHRKAAYGAEISAGGAPQGIRAVLQDNFSGVRTFRGSTISAHDDEAIQAFTADFLNRQRPLLERRCRENRIRDCHGDLRAEHVCWAETPLIFDCIEFNPAFRHCDVAAEIAFLAMDFDYYERPDLAADLVDRYSLVTGDADLPALVPFYKCYRAYVRGKVESMKSAEPEVAAVDRENAAHSARRHFSLSYRYTWAYAPSLVTVLGLSGTGKSSVATHLRERTGFRQVSSDSVRKRLAGLAAKTSAGAAYDTGLYAPEQTERTYAAMLAEAQEELRAGRGVILDATFQRRRHRDAARRLARDHDVPHLAVECRASDTEVRRRLASRAAEGATESDADWNVYLQQKAHYEHLGRDEHSHRVVLDTDAADGLATEEVEDRLRAVHESRRKDTA
jgi:aminoglycoside phosphotransferase family enzyme/predicted kinase